MKMATSTSSRSAAQAARAGRSALPQPMRLTLPARPPLARA